MSITMSSVTNLRFLTGCCSCLVVLSLMLIGAFFLGTAVKPPTGDIDLWFLVQQCKNASQTFTTPNAAFTEGTDSSMWSVSHLREPTLGTTEEMPGEACPISAGSPSPPDGRSINANPFASNGLSIALERSDGFHVETSYQPSVLLPSGSYALFSFSVSDASGQILLPAQVFALGPDRLYPWTADVVINVEPPAPPPPPSPRVPWPSPPPPPPPPAIPSHTPHRPSPPPVWVHRSGFLRGGGACKYGSGMGGGGCGHRCRAPRLTDGTASSQGRFLRRRLQRWVQPLRRWSKLL